MTNRIRALTAGFTFLLTLTLALGTAAGTQTAAACSDAAERFPMLIGSGYEGEPCELAETFCSGTPVRYPMLMGSGYEGESCGLGSTDHALDTVARSTSPTWHATMLDGSGYERTVIDAAHSGHDHD